jgi:hypothetical protein
MDIRQVVEHHETYGALSRINDTTFGVSCAAHEASATVRILQGRATVEFSADSAFPIRVPLAPVLRQQLDKYGRSFYASATQLNDFLREMA